MNYYNENDPQASAWLKELIAQGALPDGVVDDRSIEDVTPIELEPYVQCHFFAGIGGWPYALQLAGWPKDRPVWTGSCPCQPFSAAGKGAGTADERHLWPAFFWLISQCRPETVFGEQVASSGALGWWDIVSADLEGAGYACGANDLCAAGVGAFHIRQRLYWVADSIDSRCELEPKFRPLCNVCEGNEPTELWKQFSDHRPGISTLVNTPSQGHQGRLQSSVGRERPWAISQRSGDVGVVADSESLGRGFLDSENKRATDGEKHPPSNDSQASSLADAGGQGLEVERQQQAWGQCQTLERGSQVNPWQHPDWLFCRDGKARPTEPSIFPLVNGIPADLVCGSNPGMPANETAEARTMRLRGYGNAIVPQLAAQFIAAVMGGK